MIIMETLIYFMDDEQVSIHEGITGIETLLVG